MYAPLFFFFTLFTLAHDVWVHCGYECFPKKWLQGGIVGRIFPSSTQHDLHHQPKGFRYNYSAYLFLWDRITGTLYPDYFGYLKKRYCESSTENDHNSNHRLESQASGRIGAP
jgi:sterol desaturase/sphingolipid hydroxylase (fatty acid hydroxylase superfamily)